MRNINLDRQWKFQLGTGDNPFSSAQDGEDSMVNLPHDYMIKNEMSQDAPSGPATGFYTASVANYVKHIDIPKEWEDDVVYLYFDGIMMNSAIYVNGDRVALQHYGYSPFAVDITNQIYCGEQNKIKVVVNPSMQPNSRWYSGAGIYRSVELVHVPKLHIAYQGIYGYTKSIEYDAAGNASLAYLQVNVDIKNKTMENKMALVEVYLTKEGSEKIVVSRSQKIQINPKTTQTAYLSFTVENPELWDAQNPNLYRIHAKVTDLGIFKTHQILKEDGKTDETSILFGIKTVTADAKHGLRINGKVVKLKGGCVHHDNGMLGAVSLYESECRRIEKMKKIGFNALRTAHNPPSSALMEACARQGMYVFDEAFDTWGIAKQPGDYNMFFDEDWEKDLSLFVKRDRSNPAVVIWSTGNEIGERGGLNNGYTLATCLATKVKELDPAHPVSNGLCSYWSGLDDKLTKENDEKFMAQLDGTSVEDVQNADAGKDDLSWEDYSEAFTNGLDIVGYNYMEDKYVCDHELYPDRVMLGSENFAKEIGFRWPLVEKLPYVIGDFTWTAWDYIGEAGIGRGLFVDKDDPRALLSPFALLSHSAEYPYRFANDADIDINGEQLPQGDYRSIVWGNPETFLYTYNPDYFGKVEKLSLWGFPMVDRHWNWKGKEGKPLTAVVFSNAEEVEILLNGESLGKKRNGEALLPELPNSFAFDVTQGYTPGTLTAISYNGGKEVSRTSLNSTEEASAISLIPEKTEIAADGHSLLYVDIEVVDSKGNRVPTASINMSAKLDAEKEVAFLAASGSSNPISFENFTKGCFTSYRGRATAVIRSGYEPGKAVLSVKAEGLSEASVELYIK